MLFKFNMFVYLQVCYESVTETGVDLQNICYESVYRSVHRGLPMSNISTDFILCECQHEWSMFSR